MHDTAQIYEQRQAWVDIISADPVSAKSKTSRRTDLPYFAGSCEKFSRARIAPVRSPIRRNGRAENCRDRGRWKREKSGNLIS